MTTPPPSADTLNLRPLMFETFVCTVAVMSFVALVGPLARTLGLAPWQAGTTVTVGGIAWMFMARAWGIASDRHGPPPRAARRAGRLRADLRPALRLHGAGAEHLDVAAAGLRRHRCPARPRGRFLRRGAGLLGGTGGRSRRAPTSALPPWPGSARPAPWAWWSGRASPACWPCSGWSCRCWSPARCPCWPWPCSGSGCPTASASSRTAAPPWRSATGACAARWPWASWPWSASPWHRSPWASSPSTGCTCRPPMPPAWPASP